MKHKRLHPRLYPKVNDCLIWVLIIFLFLLIFPFQDFLIRFLFALGIMFQAYLFIGRNFDPHKFNRILVGTLLATIYGCGFFADHSRDNGLIENFGFFFFLFFPFFFSFTYREYILNKVCTSTIVSYALLFFFLFSTGRYQGLYFPYTIEVPLALLSIYGLYVILFIKTPNTNQLKALMAWFLLSLISLMTLEFLYHRPDASSFILDNSNYANNFFSGMLYMYVASHLWYLKSIFHRYSKYIKEEVDMAHTEIENYPISYTPPSVILAVIFIQSIMIISNYRYHFISDFLMISLWLAIIPQINVISNRFKKNKVILQREEERTVGIANR